MLCLLFSCGQGGGDKAITTPNATSAINCDSSNIKYRHKYFDKNELDSLGRAFERYFLVNVGGTNKAVQDRVLRIRWKAIKEAQDSVAKRTGKVVLGLYVDYGLDGDRFHPIFGFLSLNTTGDYSFIKGEAFSFDGNDLKREADPKKFTDAYLKNTRVGRQGGSFDTLRVLGSEPDPLATWFIYADNVNFLLAQNPAANPVLVVSCISQKLCYDAIALVSAPEYRHLLTFHVADGSKDLLGVGRPNAKNPYADHAMDMGALCPPRCEPKGH